MNLFCVSLPILRVLRVAGVLALFCALQAPAHAQIPDRRIAPSQTLLPDEATSIPGQILSTQFGDQVTRHNGTALIWESGYPTNPDAAGRVAVFTRNSQGVWVRNGSIDPPGGNVSFGRQIAIFNDFALIESSTHAFFYQRVQGKWNLKQILTPPSGLAFGSTTIWNDWAFLATSGGVYVYQITPAGTLRGVQTLRSYSGNPADGFGGQVVVSNGRVLVSAAGDSDHRGAAYVFELSGGLFVKRQKLIPINGATTNQFAAELGISGDWIAIAAPNFTGPPNTECLSGHDFGAVYVFQRVNGTWVQQDTLLSDDGSNSSRDCVELGRHVVISGTWIASTIQIDDNMRPIIYKREAGHYTPRATANVSAGPELDLHLSDGILFAGMSAEQGCGLEACPGVATLYELDKAGL